MENQLYFHHVLNKKKIDNRWSTSLSYRQKIMLFWKSSKKFSVAITVSRLKGAQLIQFYCALKYLQFNCLIIQYLEVFIFEFFLLNYHGFQVLNSSFSYYLYVLIASITDIYIARRTANKLFVFLFNHFNGFVSRQ